MCFSMPPWSFCTETSDQDEHLSKDQGTQNIGPNLSATSIITPEDLARLESHHPRRQEVSSLAVPDKNSRLGILGTGGDIG